jgi:hypothetical protein
MTGRRGVQPMPMNTLDPLGGALWVHAGDARPHNLRSTRPDWVDRATRGRPARANAGTIGRGEKHLWPLPALETVRVARCWSVHEMRMRRFEARMGNRIMPGQAAEVVGNIRGQTRGG